jgi:hypothetical protein
VIQDSTYRVYTHMHGKQQKLQRSQLWLPGCNHDSSYAVQFHPHLLDRTYPHEIA